METAKLWKIIFFNIRMARNYQKMSLNRWFGIVFHTVKSHGNCDVCKCIEKMEVFGPLSERLLGLKGQLISKAVFVFLTSSKKTNKKDLTCYIIV